MSETAQIDITSMTTNSKRTRPKGIKEKDIKTLLLKGLSTHEVGKILNCSHVNIVNRMKYIEFNREELAEAKKNFPDILLNDYLRYRNHITEQKLKDAGALELKKMMSFTHSEYRLEAGLSTSNVSYQEMLSDIDNIDAAIEQAEGKAEASNE